MKQEMEIRTGRREQDGLIRLSVFKDEMLAVTLEGHGERAPTLLLTLEQAGKLKEALSDLTRRVEAALRKEQAEKWQGDERRRLAS
jgi:hypothetical protein